VRILKLKANTYDNNDIGVFGYSSIQFQSWYFSLFMLPWQPKYRQSSKIDMHYGTIDLKQTNNMY